MYGWIWDHLPGNAALKSLCALILVAGLGWLLWFKIFPWAEPLLPFGDVTVDGTTGNTVDQNNQTAPPQTSAPTTAGG